VFQALLEKIGQELSDQNIPYMVIGGQAVLLYGEPRLTKDIDITLDMGIEGLEKIKKTVRSLEFIILVEDIDNFVKKTMVFPVQEKKSGIRIDFIFSFSPYERQAIGRSKGIRVGNTVVQFASLEDVVIHKIIAKRARDIEDVRTILLKNPDYDKTYIKKWLVEFDKSLDEDFGKLFRETVLSLDNT
jgi:hypothetical protein